VEERLKMKPKNRAILILCCVAIMAFSMFYIGAYTACYNSGSELMQGYSCLKIKDACPAGVKVGLYKEIKEDGSMSDETYIKENDNFTKVAVKWD
jgi:hypothetical protein